MNSVQRRCVVCVGLGLMAGVLRAGGPQSAPAAGRDTLLVFNQAIDAYLSGTDLDGAANGFKTLLDDPAAAAIHSSCNLYLGLIALDQGLKDSERSQFLRGKVKQAGDGTAEKSQLEKEFRAVSESASGHYEDAQQQFEMAAESEDPARPVVEAALMLGIAQLARDVGQVGKDTEEMDRSRTLAEAAETTLSDYVKTDIGRAKPYGYFFLAVAQYRLASQADERRDYVQVNAKLDAALSNLDAAERVAAAIGETAPAAGTASAPGDDKAAKFSRNITYYRGLLDTLRGPDSYKEARACFANVAAQDKGSLGENAKNVHAALENAAITNPPALQLPVPAPLGPFDFQGTLRLGNAYDSNVLLLGQDTRLPKGIRRQDDYQFGLSADFNVTRTIGNRELPLVGENLTLGVGGGTSNLWQPNVAPYDVNQYTGRTFLDWEFHKDLYFGLQYDYTYTQLGHAPFISSQRMIPTFSAVWREQERGRERQRTDIYYIHDERNYLDRLTDRRLNRDGVYHALGARQTFNLVQASELPYMTEYFAAHDKEGTLFGPDWLKFYIGGEWRQEPTVGSEFRLAEGESLVWGLHVPLPYRFAFDFDAELAWGRYGAPSIFDYDRKHRQDMIQRYNFGVTYCFVARGELPEFRTLAVKLRTGIELTIDDSNIWDRLGEDLYSYDRASYGAALEIGF